MSQSKEKVLHPPSDSDDCTIPVRVPYCQQKGNQTQSSPKLLCIIVPVGPLTSLPVARLRVLVSVTVDGFQPGLPKCKYRSLKFNNPLKTANFAVKSLFRYYVRT
jgi:hypothetical protein